MSLPRELIIRRLGGRTHLTQRPVQELTSLVHLSGQRSCEPFDLIGERSHPGTTRYRLRLAATDVTDELILDLLIGDDQRTRLTYSSQTRRLAIDRTQSGRVDFSAAFPAVFDCVLPDLGGRLELDVWVDRTSIEVFAQGGLVSLTTQVFGSDGHTGLRVASERGARIEELCYQPLDASGSWAPAAEAVG